MASPDKQMLISSNGGPKYSTVNNDSFNLVDVVKPKENGCISETNPTENASDSTKSRLPFSKLSRNKKITLLINVSAQFLMGCSISMVNPIFPKEASLKQISEASISFVFGIFYAVTFVMSPLFGRYIATLGPSFLMVSGIMVCGVSNILFGVLVFSPPGTTFLVMCLITRCFIALGASAYVTSGYAIVSNEFQESMGLACGMLQAASALGFMCGPLFGGLVYELGGYQLPLYLMGGLILTNGVFVLVFLPKSELSTTEVKGSMMILLGSPTLCVAIISMFSGNMMIANIDATLTIHLNPLNLSMGTIGLIFGVLDVTNVVATFLWSFLSDTYNINRSTIVISHAIMAVSMWFLGPSFFLVDYIPLTITSVCVSLSIMGVIRGFHAISTMRCIFYGPEELGLDYNINTLGLISGLLNATKTLGGFVGQFLVGVFQAKFTYSFGYTIEGLFSVFLLFVTSIVFGYLKYKTNRRKYSRTES